MSQLGQADLAHVIDIGDPLNRPFFQQLKRCDETLYKVSEMSRALKNENLEFDEFDETDPLFADQLFNTWNR